MPTPKPTTHATHAYKPIHAVGSAGAAPEPDTLASLTARVDRLEHALNLRDPARRAAKHLKPVGPGRPVLAHARAA